MQQLTGINAIVTSAGTIVKHILPSIYNDVPLIINAVQLFATIGTVFLLTKVGRRPLTLFGNLGLAIVDIAIGILFVFSDWGPSGMFVFALLIVYMIIYGISLGPVVWLYVPEIIPANIVPIATMMNWLGCSLCVIFTPIAIKKNDENPEYVFFFYGAITLVFFVINAIFMVETKGKNTEQIAGAFLKEN
jgi:MFS transporter, SP family, arabinose:H+ symporter